MFQLDALEYIHENSYVHADVKASNCLLGYKAGKSDTDVVCCNLSFLRSMRFLGLKFIYFFMVPFDVSTHWKHLNEMLLMSTTTYCKFGNFREGFIFTKLRICEVW